MNRAVLAHSHFENLSGYYVVGKLPVVGSRKQIGIEIHSGKNRIVRRIFEALGYRVIKLDRVVFAGLTKKGLKRGDWRFLTEQEVAMLHMNTQD